MEEQNKQQQIPEDENKLFVAWQSEQSDRLERLASRIWELRQEQAWQQLVAYLKEKEPAVYDSLSTKMGIDIQHELDLSVLRIDELNRRIDNIVSHVYGEFAYSLADPEKLLFGILAEHHGYEQFEQMTNKKAYKGLKKMITAISPISYLDKWGNILPELDAVQKEHKQKKTLS